MTVVLGLLAVFAIFVTESFAQNVLAAPPPSQYNLDERGVDLITGALNLSTTEATVGPQDQGGMAFTRSYIASEGYRDNLTGTLEAEETCQEGGGCIFTYTVSVGAYSTVFGNNLIPLTRDGSTLAQSGTNWIYTAADGTVAVFDSTKLTQWPGLAQANGGLISTLTKPNGEQWTWHYRGALITVSTPSGPTPVTFWRVQSATNNLGYQLKAEYANNAPSGPADISAFTTRTRVWAINNAVDYCDPNADACGGFTQPWQNVAIAVRGTDMTTTDAIGRVTTWQFDGYGVLQQLQSPDPARAPIILTYKAGKISTYADGAGVWSYDFQDVVPGGGQEPIYRNTTVTDPNNLATLVRSNIRTNRLLRLTLPGSRTTVLDWDQYNRLASVTDPEGGVTTYTRDIRNNITEVRRVGKPGSSLADIVQTAAYPANCSATTLRICNQPLTVTDARGGVTDYTYDASGNLLTVTGPAPTSGAPRPQTRYVWEQRYAWYKQNGSNEITQAPSPVWVLVSQSECLTGATCQ
jgi:YD repeat-containing protein